MQTEIEMVEALMGSLFESAENGSLAEMDMRSFAEAGVMTRNEGFVVRTEDGSEFQITVVRSR